VGTQAIQRIAALYKIEREIKCFSAEDRHAARQSSAKPLCKDLYDWLTLERQRVPEGGATAKAIAYSLNRWDALTAYLDNGAVQIDNNHIENLVRPWAMGRNNANCSFMRIHLRHRAIPPSVEAPTASRLLRMITATAGTASTPWVGGSESA